MRSHFAIAALTSLLTLQAFAWGTEGHQVVAGLAEAQLLPKARTEVERLLALEPGQTLVSISKWADEHRSPARAPWHRVNFPRESCKYDAERDCAGSKCVVAVIDRELAILSSKTSDERRLEALKYVVHFVADVHQPLHGGYKDDKGGNTYQLQAFLRGSNLHALWDTGLIKNMHEDAVTLTARLLAMPVPADSGDLSPVRAAEESCRIVGAPGFYPEHKVGMDYVEKFTPTVEQRLRLAGARLAGMLNQALR